MFHVSPSSPSSPVSPSPGEPVHCESGYFEGKWIRAEITEVQKGDRARKVGENGRDARGLDPPPVTRVRVYECTPSGARLREIDYVSAGANVDLTCIATLYPYNHDYDCDPTTFPDHRPTPTPIYPGHIPHHMLASENEYPSNLPATIGTPLQRVAEVRAFDEGGKRHPETMFGSCAVRGVIAPMLGEVAENGKPRMGVYCAFEDLKLRQTGHFVLKYTVFLLDLASQLGNPRRPIPALADCFGGVFAVFPSKAAPPLQLATPLTQHLARHGVIARARRTQHGHANDPALRESAVITARQATESNSPPAAAAPAAASMNAARRDSISSAAAPGSPTSSASSSRWTSASSLPSSHLNISPPLASLHLGSPTASGSPVSAAVSYASSSNGLWPAPQPSRGYYDPIRDTRRGSAESDSDGDDSDDR